MFSRTSRSLILPNNYLPIPAFDLNFTADLEPELTEPLAGKGQEGDADVPATPAFIPVRNR